LIESWIFFQQTAAKPGCEAHGGCLLTHTGGGERDRGAGSGDAAPQRQMLSSSAAGDLGPRRRRVASSNAFAEINMPERQ